SNEHPGGNVTGVSNIGPVRRLIGSVERRCRADTKEKTCKAFPTVKMPVQYLMPNVRAACAGG
ncbi:hypothetical protein, partial [Sutterella wadsworthensis]|uniref:hypothetical protein n=1 Tax=Sutterella wadsworthensis TaxID=40545 RepID=UPI00402ACBAD